MLKRKVYDRLLSWKNSPSKRALLVTGARQIGKTYIIRKFAEEQYESVVELNFILDPDAKSIFERTDSAKDIMLRLSLVSPVQLLPGRTCIFLDEIQEAPEALTAIKGLVDQGDYDFILSGSLLGVELNNIRSNPVGYASTVKMFPLDFEEFCWANGVEPNVFEYLAQCLASQTQIDCSVNERMLDLFRKYLVVGGMPDAVQTYVASNNLAMVRDVQESVRDWYRTDITKYCPKENRLKAKDAYDLVPSELDNPNKRFVLKNLNERARLRSYEDAFLWISAANVTLPVFNVEEPASPLLASKQRNLFKLFYSDVGLLTSSYSRKTALSLLDGTSEINHGSAYENAVAQELAAHGFDLYYFNSKKFGGIDFVIEDRDGEVLPIEVKSGKSYRNHSAISNVLEVENFHLAKGHVFGAENIQCVGKILYAPIYCVSLLVNE